MKNCYLIILGCLLASGPALAQRATSSRQATNQPDEGSRAVEAPLSIAPLVVPARPVSGVVLAASEVVSGAAKPFSPDSVFLITQVKPQFKGGERAFREYLTNNMRFPAQALRQRATGRVSVRFVLNAQGRVTDVTVLNRAGYGFDEEATRLVWLMPAWEPAREQGHAVRTACIIPITFQ